METGARLTASGAHARPPGRDRWPWRSVALRLLAATGLAIVSSLWLGTVGAPVAGAEAADPGTPLAATSSTLVWVRDATPVVNANKDPLEIVVQEPRFAGSFTEMIPTATSFTTTECYIDTSIDTTKVLYYLTVICEFAPPPEVLAPGKSYMLRAGFHCTGTNNLGGEGVGEQFWYSGSTKDLVTPVFVLKYYPWAPGADKSAEYGWTLTAPQPTAGATFQVYAGLWNRPPCNVTWTYRAKEKPVVATSSTTEPPTSASNTSTTKPQIAAGQRDPTMRTFTDEEFEKALADTVAAGGTMEDGYVGIVVAWMGDCDIYDYSGLRRDCRYGSKIRIGDTIVTHERAAVRVQMADRNEQRNSGPSIINLASDTAMSFKRFIGPHYDNYGEDSITELLWGTVRIFFAGWGRNSSVSVKTGATICGIRGSDVFIFYDPKVEAVGASVLEGHMDLTSSRMGTTVALTDKQAVAAMNGVTGTVVSFSQESWDEMVVKAGLTDMRPLLGAELEALLAGGTATTGATATTGVSVTTDAAASTGAGPTTLSSGGMPADGPGSTFGSNLPGWILALIIVLGVVVVAAIGVGVYMPRRSRRRASERAVSSTAAPADSSGFCPDCGSAVTPGSTFCSGCGKKL